MNAQELFNKAGESKIWYCNKCGVTHWNQERAERCCNWKCACGASLPNFHTKCDACCQAEDARKEREQFEKSEKLTEWDGWIYSEGLGHRDGYFEDVADLLEYCEEEEIDPPSYVWVCDKIHFVNASIDTILDHIFDQAYEDFDLDDLDGVDELKAAIEKFNSANFDKVSYEPNCKKSLLITKG
jgi:hypothetical protein